MGATAITAIVMPFSFEFTIKYLGYSLNAIVFFQDYVKTSHDLKFESDSNDAHGYILCVCHTFFFSVHFKTPSFTYNVLSKIINKYPMRTTNGQ